MHSKRILSIILALTMTLGMITSVHGANFEGSSVPGSIIFYDSFEGRENWSHTNGNGDFTIESDAEHSSYMKLVADDGANLLKCAFEGIYTGKTVMEFDVMADNETQGTNKYIFLSDGANNPSIARIYFANNNTLQATEKGSDDVNLGSFEADVWHHMSIEFNIPEKTYTVSMDGEEKGKMKLTTDDLAPNMNYIVVRADGKTGYLALDNMVVYIADGKSSVVPTPKVPTKYETVQRFPTPTPPPTPSPDPVTGNEVVYIDCNFEQWPEWADKEKNEHIKAGYEDDRGTYLTMDGYTRAGIDLPPIRAGKRLTMEFDCRTDSQNVNSNKTIAFLGNGQFVMRYHFNRNNVNSDLMTTHRWHIPGVSVTEGLWHHYKVVFDTYAKEYTMYIDDELAYTVAQFDVKKPMEITRFSLEMADNCGRWDLDNIRFYDPDGTIQPDEPYPIKSVDATVIDHIFSDMVGTPNSKGSIHYNGHPAETAALTLNTLGIINGYPDGTFKPDNTITRAEFAAIVARAFKLEDKPVTTEFTDVPSTHWATGNIGAAYAAGIINGYGDGTFGPEDPIKEEQAVKMVVAALGYSDDAVAKGGYPMGYIKVGNEKYISRGLNVHTGEEATRGLVAQIMMYAMGSEIKGAGKTLYNMHSDKAGESIGQTYIDAMLQDYYYYREEALEIMMYDDIRPIRVFNSLLNVLMNSTDKEERIRAARALSEFTVLDTKEYDVMKLDKAYMELLFGKLNRMGMGNIAMIANNPDEDEDVRLYAIRALYLMDRDDLVEKTTWPLAFKSKAMTVTRHLSNRAQDVMEMTNDDETVQALIGALDNSDVEIVLRAIDTLNRKGLNPALQEKAKAALPALQKMLNHSNLYIPFRAAEAIRALGGTPEKDVSPNLQPYNDSDQDLEVIIDGVKFNFGDPIPPNKIVTVSNGNINVTFDAGDGNSWAGIKKLTTYDNNKSLLSGHGFITWNTSTPSGSIVEHDGVRTRGLLTANADYVEYYYQYDPTETHPYTYRLIYRIPRGESGFYMYATVDKAPGTARFEHLYAGIMFRMNAEDWGYASLHDKLQLNLAFSKKNEEVDTEYGRKDIYQSVYRNQTGELDAKHEFYAYHLDTSINGQANDRLGFWQLAVSKDSFAKLLKNDNTNEQSIMWEGEYFTWWGRPMPEGEYHKFYGPMMVYLNKGDTFLEKWEDAKNKLAVEQEKWPYAWVEDPHYFERGSVSGKVEMADGSSPKGAYVVVNMPGEVSTIKDSSMISWTQSNSPYQYWTRADENGDWSIDNVHADTYTVTVWKEGYYGEAAVENVVVESALNTDVGTIVFKEHSNGTLSWRVGDADRTWLYDEERRYNWETIHYYWHRFPNSIEFKVGESDPEYDWNFAHVMMDAAHEEPEPFDIIWDIDGEVPEGQPILTITTCGARNTGSYGLKVYVNDTFVKMLDYSWDDSMIMRTHAYGKLIPNEIEFDKSLLHPGQNRIRLEINGGEVSYDFIQLEYK